MKQYPYIGKFQQTIKLFYAPQQFSVIESDHGLNRHERRYTNITHEYISNTWGVVESKEHAEFIILLANTHGFIDCGYHKDDNVFLFTGNKLVFREFKSDYKPPFGSEGMSKITIPLTPKAIEWPQVGDTVMLESKHYKSELSEIKYIGDSVIVYKRGANEFCELLSECKITKPKSKQELLIEALQTKLCNNNAVDNYILACDIINGEIEGLSYES